MSEQTKCDVQPIGYVMKNYKFFYEMYGKTIMAPSPERDLHLIPVFTLSPTAQQAFDLALRMAADVCEKQATYTHSQTVAHYQMAKACADAVRALTPPTDTVTLTREELEAVLLEVAEAVNYCSGQDMRAIVAQHMPKESSHD